MDGARGAGHAVPVPAEATKSHELLPSTRSPPIGGVEPRMRINILFVFLAFSLPYVIDYLLLTALRMFWHHRNDLWATLSWYFTQVNTWLNFLPAIFLFLVGGLLNVVLSSVNVKKKSYVKMFIAVLLVLVTFDQATQILISVYGENAHVLLLGEWLVFSPMLVPEMGTEFLSMGQLPPLVRLPIVFVGGLLLIAMFRLLSHFCANKPHIFASAVFCAAGFVCSIFAAIIHRGMIYDYILVGGTFIFNIMDFYLYVGLALWIQAILLDYKSLKKYKTKDVLAFFACDFRAIKTRCATLVKTRRLPPR